MTSNDNCAELRRREWAGAGHLTPEVFNSWVRCLPRRYVYQTARGVLQWLKQPAKE